MEKLKTGQTLPRNFVEVICLYVKSLNTNEYVKEIRNEKSALSQENLYWKCYNLSMLILYLETNFYDNFHICMKIITILNTDKKSIAGCRQQGLNS